MSIRCLSASVSAGGKPQSGPLTDRLQRLSPRHQRRPGPPSELILRGRNGHHGNVADDPAEQSASIVACNFPSWSSELATPLTGHGTNTW